MEQTSPRRATEVVLPQGITGAFFERIQKKAVFIEEVQDDFHKRSVEHGLEPHFSPSKIQDAYFEWMADLKRMEFELTRTRPPGDTRAPKADHLKCAAYLIFWLRRNSPINEFAHDGSLNDPGKIFMLKYGREYLAFDLGYRAAQLYECHLRGVPPDSFSLRSKLRGVDPNDFVETVSHVLKLHIISQQSILLMLKAIFLRP
jgi:hypothetical protein